MKAAKIMQQNQKKPRDAKLCRTDGNVGEKTAVVVTDDVFNLVWAGLIYQLMHRLVDGICHIKKFTQEGLGLMCLDLQVLESELKQITSLRCAGCCR